MLKRPTPRTRGQVRAISVDEDQYHRYVTNVLDAQTRELLLMVEGRSAQALEDFAQALAAHGGKVEQIALISMDRSPAYQSGASQFFPQAPDRFRSLSSYANGRPGCRSGPQGTGPPGSRAEGIALGAARQ
jgi:transposase